MTIFLSIFASFTAQIYGDFFTYSEQPTFKIAKNSAAVITFTATEWDEVEALATGDLENAAFPSQVKWEMQSKICKFAVENPDSLANYPGLEAIVDSLEEKPVMQQAKIAFDTKTAQKTPMALKLAIIAATAQIAALTDSLKQAHATADSLSIASWTGLLAAATANYDAQIATADAVFLGKIDALKIENAAVLAMTVQEINQKTVNAIYYRTTAIYNPTPRSSDFSALEIIAAQCPTTGGRAVYQARGILAYYNQFKMYKDRQDCQAQGATYRKPRPQAEPSKVLGYQVYPNPAATAFNLIADNDLNDSVLELTDALGRIVLVQKLNQGNSATIDITMFAEGVYFVRLRQADNTLVLPKLVITRP